MNLHGLFWLALTNHGVIDFLLLPYIYVNNNNPCAQSVANNENSIEILFCVIIIIIIIIIVLWQLE